MSDIGEIAKRNSEDNIALFGANFQDIGSMNQKPSHRRVDDVKDHALQKSPPIGRVFTKKVEKRSTLPYRTPDAGRRLFQTKSDKTLPLSAPDEKVESVLFKKQSANNTTPLDKEEKSIFESCNARSDLFSGARDKKK